MISKRDQIIQGILAAQELIKRKARSKFAPFVKQLMPDYEMQWFHAYICEMLDKFEMGEIMKMMILLPVQHGKSQLASRLFPPFLLGKNPNRRVGLITYNDDFAQKFSRQVQRYIDSEVYHDIFPDTKLAGGLFSGTTGAGFARNLHQFEVIDKLGSMVTVGRGGQITGLPIDILLMDDLYKNREEATSPTTAEKIWQDYNDVFKARLHNKSQQLIMNTRWSDMDLAGRLLEEEPGEWVVIKFPAIRTADVNEYDPREIGEALWPGRHSLERLLAVKKMNQVTFNSLYQQDPKPNTDLLVYNEWIELPEWPADRISNISWGLDFGKTTGINALIKCALETENAFFDECLYASNVPMKMIADVLFQNGYKEGQIVWCDHIPMKIAELRQLGITAYPAVKGEGSITYGIDKLHELTCHYTARSINTKIELNNYQWVTYGKIITRIPVDDFNHALDACRYGTVSRFFRGV